MLIDAKPCRADELHDLTKGISRHMCQHVWLKRRSQNALPAAHVSAERL